MQGHHEGKSPARGNQPAADRQRGRRSISSSGLSVLTVAVLPACVYYDRGDECGPRMSFNEEAHVCLCDDDSVAEAGGCKPCGPGRAALNGACVCAAGTQEGPDGTCQTIMGLGDPCDDERPCTHDVYSHCAIPAGASSGTCTNPCSSDGDCGAAHTCADWELTPHCIQFRGVGAECSSAGTGDPACGGDAAYCFMGQCFVHECTVTEGHAADDCPRDRKCCDVSFLGLEGASTACVLLESELCQ